MVLTSAIALSLLAYAARGSSQTIQGTEPSLDEIKSSADTIQPSSPVSNVSGLAFDRFYQVWLENIVRVPFVGLQVGADFYRIMMMRQPTRTNSGWRRKG